MREERTEVLVVGAGPVGLLSGLLLAKSGLQVIVIDREDRTTSRSYACALHPATLRLLDQLGLATPLLQAGHKISKVSFMSGADRKAQVRMEAIDSEFPYLLVVPQSLLEETLEERLGQMDVEVRWHHRLADLKPTAEATEAVIDELGGTGTGYIIPHWDVGVKRHSTVRAQYVVGADGHHSTVRQRCGIDYQKFGEITPFAAYEFETNAAADDELKVVLDEKSINVLWPLPGNRWRWTFQMRKGEEPFPEKDRSAVRVASAIDEEIREFVQQVAKQRAPWFDAPVKAITWCTRVSFGSRLASKFGAGQCWLAGDAAHQTGPAAAQSMNAGLQEAGQLVKAIQADMEGNGDHSPLVEYESKCQARWAHLLGLNAGEQKQDTWAHANAQRLLSCLPGVDDDLTTAAAQIGL
jgi:2-polyprenyl-6-methoxyphenol hydroxylase-like FAD-dependent oxidoreductase